MRTIDCVSKRYSKPKYFLTTTPNNRRWPEYKKSRGHDAFYCILYQTLLDLGLPFN